MGRLIRWLLGLLVIGSIASAVGALMTKRRLVPTTDPEANDVTLVAIFGPLEYVSVAQAFRGGTIDCWYGGGMVDLRGATLDPDGALLEVRTVFGGGQLIVPPEWRVTSMVRGIGAVQDTRPEASEADGPELVIDGIALFGGFAVSSDAPETGRWVDRTEAGEAPFTS